MLRPTEATPRRKAKSNSFTTTTFIAVAVFILVAAVGAYLILSGLPQAWLEGPTEKIVVLLVAGLVSVTLLLYFGTMVMRTAGLSTKKEALGMPEGSIRALIAVSLILMFAIIGVTVLFSAAGGDPVESKGLSAADLDRLEGVQIISLSVVDPAASPGTERFNVVARPELSEAGQDFGLQLLTTVATLVVAISSFYFGAKAVAQGSKAANDAQSAAAAARAARVAERSALFGAVVGAEAATAADEVVDPLDADDVVGAIEERDEENPEGEGEPDDGEPDGDEGEAPAGQEPPPGNPPPVGGNPPPPAKEPPANPPPPAKEPPAGNAPAPAKEPPPKT